MIEISSSLVHHKKLANIILGNHAPGLLEISILSLYTNYGKCKKALCIVFAAIHSCSEKAGGMSRMRDDKVFTKR
jgi:hypothetical protein